MFSFTFFFQLSHMSQKHYAEILQSKTCKERVQNHKHTSNFSRGWSQICCNAKAIYYLQIHIHWSHFIYTVYNPISQFSLNRLYNLYNIHPLDRHRLLTFTTLYISTLIRSYSHMKANSLNFALLLLTYLIWYAKLLWSLTSRHLLIDVKICWSK